MILKSFFTNSVGILVSRIFGFLRDLLTASVLGANIYSDIFFVAFKLPNLFRRIFAEGAFTQSFIPSFIISKNKSIFSTHILGYFLFFLLVASLVVTLFSRLFAKMMAFGFDSHTLDLAAPFVAINFYYLPMIFVVTFLGSLLQYKQHFATTAFSTALLNISLITALLLSKDLEKETIVYAMSYGVIAGGLLQVIVHILMLRHTGLSKLFYYGYIYKNAKKEAIKKEKKKFYGSFFHAILGNSTPQISAFLDTWIASFLLTGSISYLYYANRVFQLPLALFAIALSVGIFPKVARLLKQNKDEAARYYFKKGFWILFILLTLSSIGGIILAEEIIWLLFERGAFSHEDTLTSSAILQMYLIGLLPYGLAKLFALWLYSTHQQKKAAKISFLALSANVILYFFFVEPLGVKGLALASSCAGIVLFLLTIHSFGLTNFLDIIRDKKAALFIGTLILYIPALLWLKEILHGYL